MPVGACLDQCCEPPDECTVFKDQFTDGTIASRWSVTAGSFSETGGKLTSSTDGSKIQVGIDPINGPFIQKLKATATINAPSGAIVRLNAVGSSGIGGIELYIGSDEARLYSSYFGLPNEHVKTCYPTLAADTDIVVVLCKSDPQWLTAIIDGVPYMAAEFNSGDSINAQIEIVDANGGTVSIDDFTSESSGDWETAFPFTHHDCDTCGFVCWPVSLNYDSLPSQLQIEIVSSTSIHPSPFIERCTNAECGALVGTYIADIIPNVSNPNISDECGRSNVSFDPSDGEYGNLCYKAFFDPMHCNETNVGGPPNDVYYTEMRVYIGCCVNTGGSVNDNCEVRIEFWGPPMPFDPMSPGSYDPLTDNVWLANGYGYSWNHSTGPKDAICGPDQMITVVVIPGWNACNMVIELTPIYP